MATGSRGPARCAGAIARSAHGTKCARVIVGATRCLPAFLPCAGAVVAKRVAACFADVVLSQEDLVDYSDEEAPVKIQQQLPGSEHWHTSQPASSERLEAFQALQRLHQRKAFSVSPDGVTSQVMPAFLASTAQSTFYETQAAAQVKRPMRNFPTQDTVPVQMSTNDSLDGLEDSPTFEEDGAFGSRGGAFALLGAPLKRQAGASCQDEDESDAALAALAKMLKEDDDLEEVEDEAPAEDGTGKKVDSVDAADEDDVDIEVEVEAEEDELPIVKAKGKAWQAKARGRGKANGQSGKGKNKSKSKPADKLAKGKSKGKGKGQAASEKEPEEEDDEEEDDDEDEEEEDIGISKGKAWLKGKGKATSSSDGGQGRGQKTDDTWKSDKGWGKKGKDWSSKGWKGKGSDWWSPDWWSWKGNWGKGAWDPSSWSKGDWGKDGWSKGGWNEDSKSEDSKADARRWREPVPEPSEPPRQRQRREEPVPALPEVSEPTTREEWMRAQDRFFGHLRPLPPDWIRIKSKSQRTIYYYNTKTGAGQAGADVSGRRLRSELTSEEAFSTLRADARRLLAARRSSDVTEPELEAQVNDFLKRSWANIVTNAQGDGAEQPPKKRARTAKTPSEPKGTSSKDLVLADLLQAPKAQQIAGPARTGGRRQGVPAETPRAVARGPVLPAVAADGEARRRYAEAAALDEVVIGWHTSSADPTPIRLVRKGKELVQGEVFETQSDEIRKEYPDAPIAKAHRAKYNWVAETAGNRFTRDPTKMLPVVRTSGMIGKWCCDVCGKTMCGQLFVFRAFLRKEHLRGSTDRRLDTFVAYISFRCGRGLLGQLTEYTRFKEEVYRAALSLTTTAVDIDDARSQLEESMRRSSREDRQFLIDELERLAGVGVFGATKTAEMELCRKEGGESVEQMMPGQGMVLMRSAEDVFRAMARTLAPRVNARLLAAAAVAVTDEAELEGYLQGAAASLGAGGPLPQAPLRSSFREVVNCIEAVLRASNGEDAGCLRVELACSWDSSIKVFGPAKAAVTIRLGYLQARKALHAFAPSSRLSKEEASALQHRLEQELPTSKGIMMRVVPGEAADPLLVPLQANGPEKKVRVWEDWVPAIDQGDEVAKWLSSYLRIDGLRLVRIAKTAQRVTDPKYGVGETAFSDGFPVLVTSQASIDAIRRRVKNAGGPVVGIERFRPNIHVEGCGPFQEDEMRSLSLPGVQLPLVKPCSRCTVPGIDPQTGTRTTKTGGAMTKTLREHRSGRLMAQSAALHKGFFSESRRADDVYFGQNALVFLDHSGVEISVDDIAAAPHFAMRQLVGHKGFEQLFGSEINENPRRFILRNCNTKHLFEDVCYVMQGSGACARHGGRCNVPDGEVDIFVGGFPCTPYSFCNPKRFKRNCFTEPAAVPFFEMRKFIAERRPRLVILENVKGLLAPNPETEHPPIDFILRGRNPESQEDCYQGTEPNADWGLSLIEGYGLRWDILYSYDWGLPQSRPRVYIVMVREDAGGQKAAERIFDVLTACAGRLPRGSCNDFLFPEGHPKLELAKSRVGKSGGGPRKACTKFTEALFRTKRQELGIAASDRPYSKERAAGWFPQATEKMVQQLDIIYAIAEKQGLDFNFLLADLSQQVSRGAWRDDGNIPTLTTGCCFYSFSRHRPFVGEECLRLNGFPLDEMNLDHTENELIFLAGNAMSVPVIGAVLFAGLVSLDWGEGRRAVARSSLPSPLEQRPDIRKIVENSVVLAKVTPSLVDDDNEEAADALQASEASSAAETETEELALSRRAAVLLAMAKELSHEPAKREKMDKASSEPKKAGLLAAIQAVAVESTNEEDQEVEGDGTGWSERYGKIESQSAASIYSGPISVDLVADA
eukprot:s128_g21.t1